MEWVIKKSTSYRADSFKRIKRTNTLAEYRDSIVLARRRRLKFLLDDFELDGYPKQKP